MRRIGVLALLLSLTSCAHPGPASYFKNATTGDVVAACGPYIGLAVATAQAEQGCTQAYEQKGWVKLPAAN